MTDLTTQVLLEIRDGVRATNQRLDLTVERLDHTLDRLDRLERRQVEAEIRVSTELVTIAGVMREVRDAMLADRHVRETLEDHEQRIGTLERSRS